MPCLQCQNENPAEAKFCLNCGTRLAQVCSQCQQVLPPEAKFCMACGHSLTAMSASDTQYTQPSQVEATPTARHTPEAERRQLTVMFCDLVDSTRLSNQLDPEDLREVVRAYQQTCSEVIERFDGYIAQYLGDGLLIYFGYPKAHEDDAQRAVHTALSIIESLEPLNGRLPSRYSTHLSVRLGIHTGPVVVGEMGGSGRQEQLALGVTPNIAARLESMAEPNTVAISRATYRLVQDYFNCQSQGLHQAKGMGDPIEVYFVQGQRGLQSRIEATSTSGLTLLVGRQRELALLQERFSEARSGSGQAVFIAGEAGIGKSRLLHEFHQSVDTAVARWLVGHCVSYGQEMAYLPILDIVRELFGLQEADDARTLLNKVETGIHALGDEFVWIAPFIRFLLALDPGAEVQSMNPSQRRGRILEALRTLLIGVSQDQPLIILIEDLHWIDSHSEEVIRTLLEGSPTAPMLILLSYRLNYIIPLAEQTYFTRITIHRLPGSRVDTMVSLMFHNQAVPIEVRDLIVNKADGNPLFIEELSKMLMENGTLQAVTEGYQLARPLEEINIPDTLQGVILSRIDRLPRAAKSALQIAAVVGREFTARLVERVVALGTEGRDLLGELRAVELIYEKAVVPELTYLFKHALTHDVAYESLLRQDRRRLHEQVGRVIEELYDERLPEFYSTLAWHFTRGEVWSKAVHYLLKTTEQDRTQFAYGKAMRHVNEALRILSEHPDLPETGCDALEMLGDLESLQGRVEPANQAYDHALNGSETDTARRRITNKRHRPHSVIRNGARITYYEHGSGETTLFFMHPLLYGLQTFQPVLEQLCQDFRIITVDPRGCGQSDPISGTYLIRDHMEDFRTIIESAGHGPVVFIGTSKASALAVNVAATYPHLIDKLVVIGFRAYPGHLAPRGGHQLTEHVQGRDMTQTQNSDDQVIQKFYERVFTEPGCEELIKDFVQLSLNLPQGTMESFVAEDPSLDLRPLLPKLNIPTLVMHGEEDRMVPFEAGRHLAELIPHSQFHVLKGRGHGVFFTAYR